MKRLMLVLTILLSCMLNAGSAMAAGYPWKNHAGPYNFLFGNDIDAHQQTRLQKSGDLFGFFYIKFTGIDTSDGYPVATHVDCNATPGCTVGWIMRGDPGSATFLYHVETEHPVWLVNRADIPQPGAHAHFHWLGDSMPMPNQPPMDGYFLELQAVDTFCFIHHMADSASAGKTCRDNSGVVVTPGIDIATHVNIVASFPSCTSCGM